jgi:hypothetical protein
LRKVQVRLHPIVRNINLPTVLKTTILPGDSTERLFIATQTGEIFYIRNESLRTFLDIRPRIIKLGASGGKYDERGLLGLAFHPEFYYNGLFYLHYSVAGTQGPGALTKPDAAGQDPEALPEFFKPNPCDPATLNLKWTNREIQYDHIDTVEEWILQASGGPQKRRTLLNLRRPFFNHNGVNSLNFSPETLTVIAKGVRNIPGISFQRFHHQYIKHVGNVGQDLVESIFSFVYYKPIPVPRLIQASLMKSGPNTEGLINLGWRGWEGAFPTSIIRDCSANPALAEQTIAYYDEAVKTSVRRLQPLISYFHKDSRPGKFGGTALTGVQTYMGNEIPGLTRSVVFTDLARDKVSGPTVRGVLAYTRVRTDCKLNDFHVIETDDNFGSGSAFYVSLGTNLAQTRLYLGVYGSMSVTNFNQGTVFEIVP